MKGKITIKKAGPYQCVYLDDWRIPRQTLNGLDIFSDKIEVGIQCDERIDGCLSKKEVRLLPTITEPSFYKTADEIHCAKLTFRK